MSTGPLILKFGGELLEDRSRLATIVSAIARAAKQGVPLVVVHGGGKEIDAALKAAGIEKQQVDGLRITDDATLEIVVAVLAGAVNTRLVAALVASGVRAVGLTGADARCGLSDPAPAHRAVDGRSVDLGRVGIPSAGSDTALLTTLVGERFVPVVASIGIGRDGRLLNVNADTLAGHLAGRLGAKRLIVAGTTAGVLGADGSTAPVLDRAAIERLVSGGTATAGMIAKLHACEQAIAAGVGDVLIVDGRDEAAIDAALAGAVPGNATRIAGLKTCATSTQV
ncbi:MAG TPA: acetylglutamate kinase [Vicinamibacterales bacterium]